jgi:hypothetical protein
MLGNLTYVAPPDEKGTSFFLTPLRLSFVLGSLKYITTKFGCGSSFLPGTTVLGLPSLRFSSLLLSSVDVGGGIGRVSEKVLLKCFEFVDLQDQQESFLSQARHRLHQYVRQSRLRQTFASPLQIFTPMAHEYDLMWIQWVIGYLPDADLVQTLDRLRTGLKPGKGVIVIKDNVSYEEDNIIDKDDHYIIRFCFTPLFFLFALFHDFLSIKDTGKLVPCV